MRQYVPQWQSIGIDRDRYLELLHYCRQYPKWKAEAASLLGTHGVRLDGMPHGSGVSDPVALAAERRMKVTADIDLVESCAAQVGGGWYTALIQHVCLRKRYLDIDPVLMPTSNRNAFFIAKKAFFSILNDRKG